MTRLSIMVTGKLAEEEDREPIEVEEFPYLESVVSDSQRSSPENSSASRTSGFFLVE